MDRTGLPDAVQIGSRLRNLIAQIRLDASLQLVKRCRLRLHAAGNGIHHRVECAGQVEVGGGDPDIRGSHRPDLDAGGVHVVDGISEADAVFHQARADFPVVEECGVPAARAE